MRPISNKKNVHPLSSAFIHTLWKPFIVLLCCTALLLVPGQSQASEAASSIGAVYDQMTTLESVITLEGQRIRSLSKSNNDKMKSIKSRISAIDAALLKSLKLKVDQTQKKHTPLLTQYSEVNKQLSDARKRKDKKNVDLLVLKQGSLKPSVTAARADITSQKKALADAKKTATAKAAAVKEALVPVQAIKKQITAENKQVASVKKSRTAAHKRYRASIKNGNSILALAELTRVYQLLGNVHASQQKVEEWERQISLALQRAEAKLPK